MRQSMLAGLVFALTMGLGDPGYAAAAEDKAQLPELDSQSSRGLMIECGLVKRRFSIGEPVNIWCTLTNTTDRVKPIAWHASAGSHFCCVRAGSKSREGVLPRAYPQLDEAVLIKSSDLAAGYVLYLPPGRSLRMLLTYRPVEPETFKGTVVYDPLSPRGTFTGPAWHEDWISSNEIEYEVVAEVTDRTEAPPVESPAEH